MKPPEFQICSTCKHWDLHTNRDGHYTNLDKDIICKITKKVTDCNDWCNLWDERGNKGQKSAKK